VTWSAAEQTVVYTPGAATFHPYIAVLEGGYPVVSYARNEGGKFTPRIMISDNNDGTWSGSEVEFELNGVTETSWGTSVHAFGSGLYVVYGRDDYYLLGREYTTSWQAEESPLLYDTAIGVTWTAIRKGNEIHVAFVEDVTYDICHGYRDSGGTWHTKSIIHADNIESRSTQIVLGIDGVLYVFWSDLRPDVIYYKKSTDNGATWTDESGNDVPQKFVDSPLPIQSSRSYQGYEYEKCGQLAGMWLTGTTPFSIYFATMGAIDGTADLKAEFIVKKWPFADSLTINTGSVASGTLLDTYENNGVILELNEVFPGTPAFDYDFIFEDIPYSTLSALVLRLNGYYEGNPAHNVKIQLWNYAFARWDDITSATTDFPSRTSEYDYSFNIPMSPGAGGFDYIDFTGQLKAKIIHTTQGSAGHHFHIDYLKLDDSTLFSDLESQLIVRQKADIDLKAIIGVAHWIDFKAVFTVRQERFVRKRIYCKFSVRQTTSTELLAEFKVSRDTIQQNIFAEFRVNQENALGDLSAEFYIRPDHLLIKKFEVEKRTRRSRNWLR